ncbi:MAG: ABC transporter permease subunit, partial [Acidimicrobiales bacterium]
MNAFVFAIILGIGAGGLYAMLGSGIVAAFKGSGVINFAHGAIAMYAAYTWSELRLAGELYMPWFDPLPTHWLNFPVRIRLRDTGFEEMGGFWGQAIPIFFGMLMAAFIGVMLHYLVFRPLRNSPALAKVIGSVGAMLWLQAIAQLNFGNTLRTQQGFLPTGSVNNFLGLGGSLGTDRLWVLASALIMGGAVSALYRFTNFGLATRAADENEKGATLLGYSPQRLALLNWILASLMAGAAGLLFVGIATLTPVNYSLFVIPALTAALLGNLNSIWLATLGGLGLGMVQSGFVNLANRDWWPEAIPATAVQQTIPLVVVVALLYFRGDKLPIRGSLGVKGQPRAPKAKNPYLAAIMPVALAIAAIVIFTGQWEVAFTTSLVAIPVMLSLVVIIGMLGQISLAQLSLAGVAAYTAVRLASDGTKENDFQFVVVDGPGLPDFLALLLGVAAAIVVGVVIGLPALRIRGVQLAVVTITAVVAIEEFYFKNETLAGAGAVSNNPVPRPSVLGWDVGIQDETNFLPDRWQFAVFALIVVTALGLMTSNLRRGGTGRRFLAIRANERAAAAAGIDVARNKLLGFGIAAGLAGFGGVLTAWKLTSITFDNYNIFVGVAVLAFAYLGGISMASGSVNGGLLSAGGLVAFFVSFHFPDVTRD